MGWLITTDEYIRWRNVTYQIDRKNELAFVPSQVRAAGLCYRNLERRGKINTPVQETVSNVGKSVLKTFWKSFSLIKG